MNCVVMDKSSVCRLCGTGEGIKFKIFDPRRDYMSKIHQLLPIMIHEQDPWPKLICHRCAFKLQEFYDFRELCIKTDSYLKTQSSTPVQQKPWEQPAPSSWIQPPVNTNPISSSEPVRIKQEVPSNEPPPRLIPQRQEPLPPPPPPPPPMVLMQSPVYAPIPQQPPTDIAPMVQVSQKTTVRSSPRVIQSVYINPGEGDCFLPEEAESESESNGDDRQQISDHESNRRSSGTRRGTGRGRKRKCSSSDPSYGTRQVNKRKQPSRRSRVNVNKPVPMDVEQVAPRYRPGPKSFKSLQLQRDSVESRSTDVSVKVESDGQKKVRRPGPKSRVGIYESNDSDVSFVLCKPTNRVLDIIDIAEESESNGNPSEGLPSNILLTKIPGICNIFTCMLCECTITSRKCMLEHLCARVSSEGTEREQVQGGFYKCDVCSMVFTRHVTLLAHKERHLYTTSDSDSLGLEREED